jgi:prepilin-type N-terminal cleavage/methylation domain-containing protein
VKNTIFKDQNNRRVLTGKKPGVSLIELLIVLAVGLIVTGVAFSLYRLNSDYYYETEAAIQQQQNLRFAISALTSDLRMAGNGMYVLGIGLSMVQAYTPITNNRTCGSLPLTNSISWFNNCDSKDKPGVRAIFGEDGGDESSDIVTIFRSEPEFSLSVGQAVSFDYDELKLTLKNPAEEKAIVKGDILSLVSGGKAIIMEVKAVEGDGQIEAIIFKKNGRFTHPQVIPNGFSVPNALVYNLKDASIITYYVDPSQNQLLAVYHDQSVNPAKPEFAEPLVIAESIEDMQLYYFYENEDVDNTKVGLDPGISSAKLDNFRVSAVTIGLISKASYGRRRSGQVRPALFNRMVGTVVDNYNRLTTLETVQLRNSHK